MIRDFSLEAKQTLYEHIDGVSPHNSFEYIWDFFSDVKESTKEWIWKLSISDYLDDIDRYHRLVLDRENASKSTIDTIFQNVQQVDTKYAGYFQELCDNLKQKVDFVNRMEQVISIKDPIGFSYATQSLKEALITSQESDMAILMKAYENGLIREFSEEQTQRMEKFVKTQRERLGQDIAREGEEAKRQSQWLVVEVYRALDPETAKKFDTLFDSGNEPIKEFDRKNIMYIAYTADEPFRSLYLETLGMYTLGDVTADKSLYSPKENQNPYRKPNTVNLNPDDALYYDVKGPYNTFFHECGHAIDYQLGDNDYYSRQYMEGSNYDIISGDVYKHIGDEVIVCCDKYFKDLSDKEIEDARTRIISCIKNNEDISLLTDTEKKIYARFEYDFEEELNEKGRCEAETHSGEQIKALIRAGISDVYCGVTNNVIAGTRGHWGRDEKDLDGDGNKKEFTYWYDIEPPYEPTGMQEIEMWAHYFSFGITGNNEAMNDMQIYLPDTMERYNEMAKDMLENL